MISQKKKKNSLQLCPFSRVCFAVSFLSAISSPRSLCAAGLIISDCTAGLGQMWILYSSDHRLYTFISSHSPQQCKCHVDGWGRRGRWGRGGADWAWWGEGSRWAGWGKRASGKQSSPRGVGHIPAAPEEKCKIRLRFDGQRLLTSQLRGGREENRVLTQHGDNYLSFHWKQFHPQLSSLNLPLDKYYVSSCTFKLNNVVPALMSGLINSHLLNTILH